MAISPTMIQYKAKYDNLLFLTKEIIHVQATNPDKKAAIKPIVKGRILALAKSIFPPKRSLAILPKINGITIRKEKRAALVLSFPSKTEVEIVAPLLEIPGNIAIA